MVVAELAAPNETVGTDPGVATPSPTRMRANIKPRPIIGRVNGATSLTGRSAATVGPAAMSAPKTPQACKKFFTSPPSVNSLRVKSYGFYALNSVTLQQQSIGMADPWRTLNRLARAIGDRALAGNAVLRRPTPDQGLIHRPTRWRSLRR